MAFLYPQTMGWDANVHTPLATFCLLPKSARNDHIRCPENTAPADSMLQFSKIQAAIRRAESDTKTDTG